MKNTQVKGGDFKMPSGDSDVQSAWNSSTGIPLDFTTDPLAVDNCHGVRAVESVDYEPAVSLSNG